jgi:hypothetical protein
MFNSFGELALPLCIAGGVFIMAFPGFLKLLPLITVGGVLWALFYVAKGFAMADKRYYKK